MQLSIVLCPLTPLLSRACKRHVEVLELAKLYGVQQHFRTSAVQHRVQRNGSAVLNEHRLAGRTFWGDRGVDKVGVDSSPHPVYAGLRMHCRNLACTAGALLAT